jgi:SAM-dependent methyltransferase
MTFHDRVRIREAWTAFWQDPDSGQQCVRGAPDVTQALTGCWSAFAASLDSGTHILDLGCGAGAAAQALVATRHDLQVTGIDFAAVPPAADARIALMSDTAMEHLPFEDNSFDAAVSQFGFEYSRTHKSARQLARVLAPQSRFAFIVHHAGSSVVATNRARLKAIRTVRAPDLRAAFVAGSTFALGARLSSLQRAHPGDTLVDSLARLLPARAKQDSQKRIAMWSAVEEALSPECTVLEALDACCVAPEELDGWLGPLRQFFDVATPSILRKPNGDPIAWRIEGMRLPDTRP